MEMNDPRIVTHEHDVDRIRHEERMDSLTGSNEETLSLRQASRAYEAFESLPKAGDDPPFIGKSNATGCIDEAVLLCHVVYDYAVSLADERAH